jgi:hypothetical protein
VAAVATRAQPVALFLKCFGISISRISVIKYSGVIWHTKKVFSTIMGALFRKG